MSWKVNSFSMFFCFEWSIDQCGWHSVQLFFSMEAQAAWAPILKQEIWKCWALWTRLIRNARSTFSPLEAVKLHGCNEEHKKEGLKGTKRLKRLQQKLQRPLQSAQTRYSHTKIRHKTMPSLWKTAMLRERQAWKPPWHRLLPMRQAMQGSVMATQMAPANISVVVLGEGLHNVSKINVAVSLDIVQ